MPHQNSLQPLLSDIGINKMWRESRDTPTLFENQELFLNLDKWPQRAKVTYVKKEMQVILWIAIGLIISFARISSKMKARLWVAFVNTLVDPYIHPYMQSIASRL